MTGEHCYAVTALYCFVNLQKNTIKSFTAEYGVIN